MTLPIYKTIFGIRHKRLFNIMGFNGKIIDDIVADYPEQNDNPFSFSKIGWKPNHIGVLLSNKTGNLTLDIDIDGIVLTYHFLESDKMTIEGLTTHFKDISTKVLKNSESYKYINRIGIMNYYSIETTSNAAKVLEEKYLGNKLNGSPDNFILSFAKKDPTATTLVRSDTLDYSNVIVTIGSERQIIEEPESPKIINITIDYQIYFNPDRTFEKTLFDNHYKSFMEFLGYEKTIDFFELETR
jgi:hypothetical protein